VTSPIKWGVGCPTHSRLLRMCGCAHHPTESAKICYKLRPHRFLLLLYLALLVPGPLSADDRPRSHSDDLPESRPKVRTITAFIHLNTADYKRQLSETAATLNIAKKKFEQGGWVVETIRITTQPFPEFVRGLPKERALALLLDLDKLAAGSYERTRSTTFADSKPMANWPPPAV
jgi:hypothetical protein